MAKWRHAKGAIKLATVQNQKDQFTIIGPYGNVWTDDTFDSPAEAEAYLRGFWGENKSFDLGEWRVALASVEITALEPSWRFDAHQPGPATQDAPNLDRNPDTSDRLGEG